MTTQERAKDARADADATTALRRDAASASQDDARDIRLHSDTRHGAIGRQTVSSTSLFSRSITAATASLPKGASSRIPRFALGSSEPPSPQASWTSVDAPSSVASTTESVSSRIVGIRAVDNGTPSRLAQFRAKNWVRDAGRKRALEMSDAPAAANPPPKRRAVTSLFSDEPRRVAVSTSQDDGASDEDEDGSDTQQQDQSSDTLSVVSYGVRSLSQSSSSTTDSYADTRLRLQQEIKVGKCLEQDLTRDNARMKLKMDSLRDDIDYYYELLAKIEAVAVSARRQAAASASPDGAKVSANASAVSLAEAVQRIISAPKADKAAVPDDVEK